MSRIVASQLHRTARWHRAPPLPCATAGVARRLNAAARRQSQLCQHSGCGSLAIRHGVGRCARRTGLHSRWRQVVGILRVEAGDLCVVVLGASRVAGDGGAPLLGRAEVGQVLGERHVGAVRVHRIRLGAGAEAEVGGALALALLRVSHALARVQVAAEPAELARVEGSTGDGQCGEYGGRDGVLRRLARVGREVPRGARRRRRRVAHADGERVVVPMFVSGACIRPPFDAFVARRLSRGVHLAQPGRLFLEALAE